MRRSPPAAIASAPSVEPTASPIGVPVRSITSPTSRSRAPANGISIWREDAAGNHQPANASVPVTLRYDPEPPDLGFEEPSAADPTLVSALVTDKVSGLAGGEIELSAQGSRVWETLPTRQEGSRLRARIDDAARHPPGTYVLRATARDRATNENSTESRLDGRPMTLTLPLRARTSVRAGVRRTVRRHGPRPRRRAVLERKARVSFGHRVRVTGVVRTPDGRPLGDAPVQVLARTATSPERALAATSDRSARTLRVSDEGDCDHDLARRLSRLRYRPFRRSARYRCWSRKLDSIGTHPAPRGERPSGDLRRRSPLSAGAHGGSLSSCRSGSRCTGRPSGLSDPTRAGLGESATGSGGAVACSDTGSERAYLPNRATHLRPDEREPSACESGELPADEATGPWDVQGARVGIAKVGPSRNGGHVNDRVRSKLSYET